MSQIKRQRVDSDEVSTKKLQVITIDTNRLCSTQFEDLSNEVIYEIFEFFDAYYIYKGFINLNTRFQSLLWASTIPLKINNLLMSKSKFHLYYRQFILPNLHRIRSFNVSCTSIPFFVPLILKYTSKFTRLQALNLHKIEIKDLENLLQSLICLSNLTLLTITTNDRESNKNTLYYRIFQLPILKYCKLSFADGFGSDLLPTFNNEYSPIEYLSLEGACELDQLASLLSYVPQLRRLSINYPLASIHDQTERFPIVLNHLTHANLRLDCIGFHQFVPLVKKLFQNLQVLHISTSYGNYLNADQWERLILLSMPYLRIFDIQYTNLVFDNRETCQTLFSKFNSSFWSERKWFFSHRHHWGDYSNRGIFYSTKPYRRKYYSLHGKYDRDICLCGDEENNNKFVRHLNMKSEKSMIDCSIYFPNVTELTISNGFFGTRDSITTHLNRIIPLSQITILTIHYQKFPFGHVIEILRSTPNCHTLTFGSLLLDQDLRIAYQVYNSFLTICNKTNLKHITITSGNVLSTIRLFICISPRVEHFTINLPQNQELEPIIQFLLSETTRNTCYLCSLCLVKPNRVQIENLKGLIDSNKLLENYSLQIHANDFYLRW